MLIATLAKAARGDSGASQAANRTLRQFTESGDGAALAEVLRRVLDGERDERRLLDGLNEFDSALVTAVLRQLEA